jgi:hypothetical protein
LSKLYDGTPPGIDGALHRRLQLINAHATL